MTLMIWCMRRHRADYGVFNDKGKFSKAIREKLAEKSEDFDTVEPFPDNGMNYVTYTDGT